MPSSGVGGATNQSLPNASFAPASISDRNAYVVLILAPMYFSGPSAVVDGVIRLHAGDHAQRRKPRDVGGCRVLRVLDAEATVSLAVLAGDAIVGVEQQRVGTVADGVHHHVQAGFVGAGDPGVEVFGRVDQQPPVLRGVVKRRVKRGRVRPERAVDEAFQRADAQPLVAAAIRAAVLLAGHDVAKTRPVGKRHGGVDARAEGVGAPGARKRRQLRPRAHVVDRGHALLGDVLHRGGQRAVAHRVGRVGHDAIDQAHRVVLQQACRVATRIADDLAAGHAPGGAGHSRRLQRCAVGKRHVAVEPVDPDGVIRESPRRSIHASAKRRPTGCGPSRRP